MGRGNVGERLRQARVRAGLSLAEISARTKIRTPLLEAIEREDFARLPAGILGRGCLRAFAQEVGLDPESVVRDFTQELEPDPASGEPAPPPPPAPAMQEPGRGHPYFRLALAASVVAGLSAAVLVVLAPRPGVDDAGTSAGAPADVPAEDAATVGQDVDAVEADTPDEVVPAVDTANEPPLTLAISPADVVWVEATADDKRMLYQLVYPGDELIIDAREEIVLRVGDAAAFQYSLNGQPGRPLGPQGAVRSMRITRENYTAFQEP